MSELTISMPAFNAGKYIHEAIASVLQQAGVDLELIIVDDASTDDTVEQVGAFSDPRIRLLRNQDRRGIGCGHNRVLAESASPYIAHVDADDVILPGALRKLLDLMETNETLGQAHCYDVDVDEAGHISREAFEHRLHRYTQERPVGMNYREALLARGCVINHLRTYRRSVLEELGGFNEEMAYGMDYEMALRIVDRYEIGLVPEVLYCHRLHDSNVSDRGLMDRLKHVADAHSTCRRLATSGEVAYLRQDWHACRRALLKRWLTALSPRPLWQPVWRAVRRQARAGLKLLFHLARNGLHSAYDRVVRRMSWWPIRWLAWTPRRSRRQRTAYFIWHFPVLSQTFVQREVRGLLSEGVDLEVIAFSAEDVEHLDPMTRRMISSTHYVQPDDRKQVLRYVARFLLRHPLRMANLFLYVVFHRHGEKKDLREDLKVYGLAVLIAGVMRDRGLDHIHSPWANRCAFVAAVTSRLLNIRYTVHARAYDMHREDCLHALPEVLRQADGILTNSRYNERLLASMLKGRGNGEVHALYNCLEFERFVPLDPPDEPRTPAHILCVARLTEQKGLEYLLRACAVLQEEGISFQCKIIGTRIDPDSTRYYIMLRRLQRALGLTRDVQFLGAMSLDRVIEQYRQADLFVLPAVIAEDGSRDITPNAMIEAMAMRLPVVATDITAIPEIVDNGVSGLLVPPHDVESLAAAMRRILEDPAMARQLGAAARSKVLGQFDARKNAPQFAAFFGQVK